MTCSFVLLCYNQEEYIAEALAAALAQDGPPIEIVVSDDCSKDGSYRVIHEVAASYQGPHRLIVRRNETNLGMVANLRTALQLCSGDVMILAGGDDASMPDRALRISEVFQTTDAWLVHSHATCIDLEGNEIPPTYLPALLVKGEGDLRAIAVSGSLYLGATGAFHRKLFDKYGHITTPRAYEDLIYGFRASMEAGVHFIDRPLVRYRVGSGSSTSHRLADAEGKRRAEIRTLRMLYAVMSQRRRDALAFGLSPKDPIIKGINDRRLSILFQLFFWDAINGARTSRLMVRHPKRMVDAFRHVLMLQDRFENPANGKPRRAKGRRRWR